MSPAAVADLVLPEKASLPTRLRLAMRALLILKDDPANPVAGPLVNACLDTGAHAALIEELRRNEEGRRLLSERPSLQGPDLDLTALEMLPEGSLGALFAAYFRANGIQPFVTTFEIRNDLDYISKRYRETHDLYHVLTGYGTDVPGEMELQAFVLGNLGLRAPVLIVLFGTALLLKEKGPRWMVSYLRRVKTAYQRGANSRSFMPFPFEKHWATPVETLRQELLAGGVG